MMLISILIKIIMIITLASIMQAYTGMYKQMFFEHSKTFQSFVVPVIGYKKTVTLSFFNVLHSIPLFYNLGVKYTHSQRVRKLQ